MFLFWRVAFIFICMFSQYNADPNVAFAAVVFRHGDRTIVNSYPNDPWKDNSAWSIGFGQLTNTGKMQQYNLGQMFRKRYGHLLSDEYRFRDIYVRSTNVDRTIMSALSNLAGLYTVKSENEFLPGLSWTPIPVHTVPLSLDRILAMKAPCFKYDYAKQKLLTSDIYKNYDEVYHDLYEYLSHHSGQHIASMETVGYLYDTLKVEQIKNFTLPEWTKDVYPEKMEAVTVKSLLTDTYNPTLARLKVGPMIKEITELMSRVVLGSSIHKVVYYSAHDTTIVNLLNALGMYDGRLPEYTAHLLIELVKGESECDHVVRITYNGNILEIPGCGSLCPLDTWKEIYAWLIPDDIIQECMYSKQKG